MKKLLLLCMMLMAGLASKAQDIQITNQSCTAVVFTLGSDLVPSCNQKYVTGFYNVLPGQTLSFSMFGGTYPAPTWSATGAPPSTPAQWTNSKIFDPSFSVGFDVWNPCGGPSLNGANFSCGTVKAKFITSNPALTQIMIQ